MRGRKPGLKSLRMPVGDKGKAHPRPEIKIPSCPEGLTPAARGEWKRVTKLLKELGLVAELDRTALAVYCQAWATWLEAQAEIAKTGKVVKSPSGFPILNPWLSVANAAYKQMQQLLSEFGFSPAARSRIIVAEHPEIGKTNQWEGLLADAG